MTSYIEKEFFGREEGRKKKRKRTNLFYSNLFCITTQNVWRIKTKLQKNKSLIYSMFFDTSGEGLAKTFTNHFNCTENLARTTKICI